LGGPREIAYIYNDKILIQGTYLSSAIRDAEVSADFAPLAAHFEVLEKLERRL
jgi:hypothetical protein